MASAPRLLLFGSTGSGKSSLLGALAQAAGAGAPALKGRLVDKSGALEGLKKSTYEPGPASTGGLEEYDIRLESAGAPSAEATLLDCSGKEAQSLLKSEEAFANKHPLHKPILGADAVLLLVDVSLSNKERREQFDQFGRWLMQLHEARGRRAEVGALPVYLVLTKCDLLARKDDTFRTWTERIEEGKRRIGERFREYLKEQGTGFGSLDLRLAATAIKRPALADRPAKAHEPFGVAELFRESLEAAGDFLDRRQVSQRRLQNVLAGLVGVIALLGLAVVFLAEFQPDNRSASLEDRAHSLLPKKDTPPEARVYGSLKKLEEKKQLLSEVQQDSSFGRLPEELQNNVAVHRQEIEEYVKTSAAMKTEVKFPFMAETEEAFAAQEMKLGEFTYRPEWQGTPLGRRVQQAKQEYERVHVERKKEEEWIEKQIEESNRLIDDGSELVPRLRKALADERKLKPKLQKKLELTPTEEEIVKKAANLREDAGRWTEKYRAAMKPTPRAERSAIIPGVSAVTYEYLDRFDAVKAGRKRWDEVKKTLNNTSAIIQSALNDGA